MEKTIRSGVDEENLVYCSTASTSSFLGKSPSRHPTEVTVETEDGEGVVQIEGTPEQVAEVTGVGKDAAA